MVTKGKNIYGAGMLDSGMSISLEQYVIDDEIIGAVRRSLDGIPVNDETLDLETVKMVGPAGHYLSQKSTLNKMTMHYTPKIFSRDWRMEWEKKGWPTIYKLACEKVDNILATHKIEPFKDKDVLNEMRKILTETEKEWLKTPVAQTEAVSRTR